METARIGDDASIVVRNENGGAPISEAQLRTLFDPFKRGDGTGHAKGLGLGLYIVHEIIRGHGGTVVAVSDDVGDRVPDLDPDQAASLVSGRVLGARRAWT